jgi:hypothetical protein
MKLDQKESVKELSPAPNLPSEATRAREKPRFNYPGFLFEGNPKDFDYYISVCFSIIEKV